MPNHYPIDTIGKRDMASVDLTNLFHTTHYTLSPKLFPELHADIQYVPLPTKIGTSTNLVSNGTFKQ